jgi:hypothetical protein
MMQDELAQLNCAKLEIVAFATNKKDGRHAWTELAIYFRPDPETGRNFIAEVKGRYQGPDGQRGRDTTQRVYVASAERAVAFFDPESRLTSAASVQALDWQDRNRQRLASADGDSGRNQPRQAPIQGFTGSGGLKGALAWLYEGETGDLSKRAAADFGVSDRTIRNALKMEADGQKLSGWVLGFIAALSGFDRDTLPHRRAAG